MAASIKPSIAIISLGSMGVGIARLLVAHRYPVLTSLQDRSPSTAARVLSFANSVISRGHSFRVVSTDAELVAAADVVLSIVPPEHAHGMAVRIADAVKASTSSQQRQNGPLYLLDLNAVSPRQARETAAAVKSAAGDSVIFIDGGIIGGPPQASDPENPKADVASWTRPSIPLSGPHTLASLSFPSLLSPKSSSGEDAGKTLANVLNVRHVGSEIGKASGLKMCFASMTKGLTAIGIQAFTTAQRLGVREELEEHMAAFAPVLKKTVMGGLVGMPPKGMCDFLTFVVVDLEQMRMGRVRG